MVFSLYGSLQKTKKLLLSEVLFHSDINATEEDDPFDAKGMKKWGLLSGLIFDRNRP